MRGAVAAVARARRGREVGAVQVGEMERFRPETRRGFGRGQGAGETGDKARYRLDVGWGKGAKWARCRPENRRDSGRGQGARWAR